MPVTHANTEPYHIQRVADLYAQGSLNTVQLERAIEHVLRGGYLNDKLELRAPVMDKVRKLRKQRNCPHNRDLIDISGFHTLGEPETICTDCGATVSR